ncbi:hypothetical protein EW026_g7397 [Hermanssonia centrifuga]|uniref:HCP-like protein n=1 Tax=Hermanssonia centrifuga TaxID=98765 RepID=A0A4S4K7Z0_9APHY|nr:hypothetical protein EW026_g7397 [Hermanssonia centrifuga]
MGRAGHLDPSNRGSHLTAQRDVSMASQYSVDDIMSSYRDSYITPPPPLSPSHVPKVVVSTPDPYASPPLISPNLQGRVPSRLPAGTANFSRPVGPPQTTPDPSRARPPVPGSEEQKRQVLMRHTGSQPNSSFSSNAAPHPNANLTAAPPRPTSQVESVYSNYSYYPYDGSPVSSPNPTQPSFPPQPRTGAPQQKASPSLTPDSSTNDPQSAQDYLQLGITHHLSNRLPESARHGWGCEKSEERGFKWLRKAAEVAVGELEKGKQKGKEVEIGAVQSELVLAIYEVGQSFFRGWGVEKDKQMAVNYFRLAARLGDPDAQQDLAFCLANGKGCKKDKKEAAKWYRDAVAQGVSDIGLAWIYKEKYQ